MDAWVAIWLRDTSKPAYRFWTIRRWHRHGCYIGTATQLRSYIVPKGFVALNGVSLTVVDVSAESFSISLIPYNRDHTNLGQALGESTRLNVETDIIGRYVAQFLQDG